MKINISSDHAGFKLKKRVVNFLLKSHEVNDLGPHSEESVDYPDFAHKLVNNLLDNDVSMGVLICGSANGISMAANKHKNIRAAVCWNKEIAILAKQHNDANVVSLPARFITENEAIDIIEAFINTDFEGGRHLRRVNKINCV
ncbi:MAG: ribose 5-phosphate isomerase B [Flavobacteriales bacterium]|jgi:ribose 5-phosphate isomerase B|nr:ribose 5-phosphate isomerase B [Flavobacteriales bacterium]